jgi:hypothetical protein
MRDVPPFAAMTPTLQKHCVVEMAEKRPPAWQMLLGRNASVINRLQGSTAWAGGAIRR